MSRDNTFRTREWLAYRALATSVPAGDVAPGDRVWHWTGWLRVDCTTCTLPVMWAITSTRVRENQQSPWCPQGSYVSFNRYNKTGSVDIEVVRPWEPVLCIRAAAWDEHNRKTLGDLDVSTS